MREIVLDTETTGFEPSEGDRIVEIGAIELENHMPTGKTFHKYLNPQRDMPEAAQKVHGLSSEFLSDKPLFEQIAQDFLDFIGDSKLVIHNAAFDMKFLNAELKGVNLPQIPTDQAIDTLAIARRKFPGSPASLDALCRRFGIDNSNRTLHGALLDSEILATVYLELIGGIQPNFLLASAEPKEAKIAQEKGQTQKRKTQLAPRITEEEQAAHHKFVKTLGDRPLWSKFTN